MAQNGRVPGEDHPITVEPTTEAVRVSVGDRLIARSTTALTLREAGYPPVRYVPLADVDPGVLRRSATTTYCPHKGTAAYYDLVLGDEELTDAVWAYEQPYDAVSDIADHVAFYPGPVKVTVGT
ncbi:DUF427 domain-containing protein [Nocardiopsis sp. L17-MgMaSL7]|uniref:DUF427 domain-containing protein n=1 Tax=Nocardiopsis sp. L17-MgMaSL7 TaxID=1938893 RepID=UPI000D71CDEC|nr:DUF427 domain-containing protein [Nocardiopsis sp. L17-MgMaSL7]PWV49262.1 uncharacterized protein (DUF427 family) [Nocardiopsis sp. L17-MgMaSL7]